MQYLAIESLGDNVKKMRDYAVFILHLSVVLVSDVLIYFAFAVPKWAYVVFNMQG